MNQPAEQPKLTDKQRAFVLEYVQDWNATQAAIRAGYSVNSASEQSYDLLRKPQIRSLIDQHLEGLGITADRILAEQAALAFTDMKDFVEVEEGGGAVFKAFGTIGNKTKAIRKIKEKRKILTKAEGDGEEVIIDSQIEFELYDKQKSLDTLAKHVSRRERVDPPGIQGYTTDPKKEPAQQLVDLLSFTVNQSQQGKLDPKLASSIASLATALLKANEQGELEERIKTLESLQKGSIGSDDLGLDFSN